MSVLWFGKAKKLEDLKEKDLKKERLVQEVQQDQLVSRIKRAQDEYDGMLDAASQPGLSDAETDVAAYKMDLADRRKIKAEAGLQGVLTRLQVVDATLDVLGQRKELEKKGVWKTINEIPEDKLQEQLEEFAIERKESVLNVNKIAEMLETDPLTVKSHRTAGMRRAKAAIEEARAGRR
jgi:hypothetical protein